jgi:hypothetical protein
VVAADGIPQSVLELIRSVGEWEGPPDACVGGWTALVALRAPLETPGGGVRSLKVKDLGNGTARQPTPGHSTTRCSETYVNEPPGLSAAKRALLERWRRGELREANQDAHNRAIAPRSADTPARLSLQQEGLYARTPEAAAHHLSFSAALRTAINIPALAAAVCEIARRHETLRTAIAGIDDIPHQVVHPKPELKLTTVDLSDMPWGKREHEAIRRSAVMVREPFTLSSPPLSRVTLFTLTPRHHLLTIIVHHIIGDGWSLGVALHELTVLYEAFAAGRESPLPDLPIQFGDYAAWQRAWIESADRNAVLPFWREQLRDIPMLSLPFDHAPPDQRSYRGGWVPVVISESASSLLRSAARSIDATPFVVLLALFNILLLQLSGQSDIVVAVPSANRRFAETHGLIGFFSSTIPVRNRLSGDLTLGEALERVRDTFRTAYAHFELPIRKMIEEIGPGQTMEDRIYQVRCVLQPTRELRFGNVPLEPIELESGTAASNLELQMWDEPERLRGRLEYSTDVFDRSTIESMSHQFTGLINSLSKDMKVPISQLPSRSQS